MGNAQTRPSANTAIDYEEDEAKIQMINFRITEAPVDDLAPPGSSSQNGSQVGSTRASTNGGNRLRLFSTFQSASRPSLSVEDAPNRMKLSELLESGVQIAMEPGEFNSDSYFIKRIAYFEYKVKDKEGFRDFRGLFCKDLDDSLFRSIKVGSSISDEVLMRPNLRNIKLSDKDGREETYEDAQDIYLPENGGRSRRLYMFFVHGASNTVLVKSRVVLMDENDKEKMNYIEAHMTERDERTIDRVEQLKADSVMKVFNSDELAELFDRTRKTPKPPTKYMLGAKGPLLGFRVYAPANRDAIVANLILVSIDSTLLEALASSLSTNNPIRVIVFDMRGFGYSGGRRGDTPSTSQVYKDIGQLVKHVRGISNKPVILGGFAFGAGMVANYSQYIKKQPVDGYIMISPVFGRPWMNCWREELVRMYQKDRIIVDHPLHLMMARITNGRIGGSRYVFKMKFDERMSEFSPMHVGKLTARYVLAYTVPQSGKLFGKFDAPLAIFSAENDEFCLSEKLESIISPHLPEDESCFHRMKNKSGLGMLSGMTNELATWIMSLRVVKPWSAAPPARPQVQESDLSKLESVIPSSVQRAIKEGINHHIYDHTARQTDCANVCPVTYDLWEPTYLPGRPLAVLMLLATRVQSSSMTRLAEQHRILVFRVDPWKVVNGKLDISEKKVSLFFENSIRLIKANFPGTPLFIGGAGIGANLIIGYSKRKDRHPVNGYLLISPPADPNSPANKPFVKEPNSSLSTMHYGMVQDKDVTDRDAKVILGNVGYVPWLVNSLERVNLSKDLISDIQGLDAPVNVLLPRDSPTFDYQVLAPELEKFLKPPFKNVELLIGNEFDVIENSTSLLGEWMMQLSTSMSPRFPLILRQLTMEDFEPIELIGKGTFGRVFLVRHIQSSRFLAMKVLDKDLIVRSKQVNQVMREKTVMAECSNCPFIVSFVGSFQDVKRLYIVMEFVIGGELFTRLNTVKKFTVDEARFYICEVIMALSYLHEREIVYRDLKPENIVLDALGHVRLVDFGFARHLNNGRCTSFCGSPFYIAPEMLSNSEYGKSVDIWALGVLLFELLVGAPPFSGNSANEVYRKILFSKVDIPSNLDSDSKDLLESLLDPSPDSRLGVSDGLDEVKAHKWFKGVDWSRVSSRQLPTPFQPHFTFEGDTNNFNTVGGSNYDFDIEEGALNKYPELFQGF